MTPTLALETHVDLLKEHFGRRDSEPKNYPSMDSTNLAKFQLVPEDVERAMGIALNIANAVPGAIIHDELIVVTPNGSTEAEVPCIKVHNPETGAIFVQVTASQEDILNTPFDFSSIRKAQNLLNLESIQKFDISAESYRLAAALSASIVREEQVAENLKALRDGASPRPVQGTLTLAGGQPEILIMVGQPENLKVLQRIPLEDIRTESSNDQATIQVGDHSLPLSDWSAALAERDDILKELQREYPGVALRASDKVFINQKETSGPHLRIEQSPAKPHIIPIIGAAKKWAAQN